MQNISSKRIHAPKTGTRGAATWSALGVASLMVLLAAPHAFAESRYASPRDSGAQFENEFSDRHRMSKAERKELRRKIHKKVHQRMTSELSKRLQLDEGKSAQLAEALKRHGDERRTHGKRLRKEMKKLKKLVAQDASEAEMRRQMENLAEARQARKDGMQSLLQETESFLTTKEQATLMLAFPRVMKDTRRMMRMARRDKRREHRGERGFGPPHHDDDMESPEPFGFED